MDQQDIRNTHTRANEHMFVACFSGQTYVNAKHSESNAWRTYFDVTHHVLSCSTMLHYNKKPERSNHYVLTYSLFREPESFSTKDNGTFCVLSSYVPIVPYIGSRSVVERSGSGRSYQTMGTCRNVRITQNNRMSSQDNDRTGMTVNIPSSIQHQVRVPEFLS